MKVRWTGHAVADLHAIREFIHRENPEAALAMARRIFQRIEALQTLPNRGRVGRVEGTRELILAPLPYVAVYEILDETVTILRILHGARRWP